MELYKEIYKMKELIRKGWIIRNIPNRNESDAEHTFSMTILALDLLSKNNLKLDELKVLKMIAYHDLCEIDPGDTVVLFEKVTEQEKFDKEYACIKRLSKTYKLPEIESIWLEFMEQKSKEAKFVKLIDKYDAVCQAKIYAEKYNRPEVYEEFRLHAIDICNEIEKLKF